MISILFAGDRFVTRSGRANASPTSAAPPSRASSRHRVASHPLCDAFQLTRADACRANLFASTQETPCAEARFAQIVILPNTHGPVVVCLSAGIWTTEQLTVPARPPAPAQPANPPQTGPS